MILFVILYFQTFSIFYVSIFQEKKKEKKKKKERNENNSKSEFGKCFLK